MSCKLSTQRRGSVYVAVTGTAILVSLIGLTSLHLSRLEFDTCTSQHERAYARQLAQTGVEFAMAAIELDPNWRSNYTHGDESPRSPIGLTEDIVFRFLDNADGDLANDSDQEVEIQGIGRCGSAEFRYSVTYAPSVTSEQQVATVIDSYDAGTSTNENVGASNYLGQYFIPTLPAEATNWSVTSVDLYLMGHGAVSAILDVGFYHADGSGQPGALIESVAVDESLLPAGSYDWHSVSFGSVAGLTPGAGFCLTLECSTGGNAAVVPYATGLNQTNKHLLRGGSGVWYSPSSTQSIQYRINGVYTTSAGTGPFAISPGSWKRVSTP